MTSRGGVNARKLNEADVVAVLDDRTQAPSGAGYALENRLVISSVLPEAFRAGEGVDLIRTLDAGGEAPRRGGGRDATSAARSLER